MIFITLSEILFFGAIGLYIVYVLFNSYIGTPIKRWYKHKRHKEFLYQFVMFNSYSTSESAWFKDDESALNSNLGKRYHSIKRIYPDLKKIK